MGVEMRATSEAAVVSTSTSITKVPFGATTLVLVSVLSTTVPFGVVRTIYRFDV